MFFSFFWFFFTCFSFFKICFFPIFSFFHRFFITCVSFHFFLFFFCLRFFSFSLFFLLCVKVLYIHGRSRHRPTNQSFRVCSSCDPKARNNCINELQHQTDTQRLELQDAHHGHVQSRREQVRLQEELAMKEKALRDTQIRSMHEMGEMKTAQEIRVDEFSAQILRESHDTIQRLTSQIQELQERMNCLNDSGEFQEVESNYSVKLPDVPSQPAVIPSPRFYAELRQTLVTWHMESVWIAGKRFWQSTFNVRVITNTLVRNSSLYDTKCRRCGSSACLYRGICYKRWRTNWEHNANAGNCRKAVDHESLSVIGYSTEFYYWTAKTADIGTGIW